MQALERDAGLSALSPAQLAPARRPLAQAHTLPAAAFRSPAVYAREVERLFRRQWLCVAREEQLRAPGDYRCVDLLGEKLVLVRGRDGRVRALSRVCRHRAAEIVQGSGNASTFVCPYHAWAYHLDGRLAGAPLADRIAGFDPAACHLPELRSECWEGFVFVSFDDGAPALGPQLAPLSRLLAPYAVADRVAWETTRYASAFNWKVLVDNFMEAYHHVATHRDTLQPLFPAADSHVPDNAGPYSLLVMPPRGASSEGAALPLVAAVVYPFHLFAATGESLAWYQIVPERHDRFTLHITSCFAPEQLADADGAARARGLHAFTRQVHEQDVAACEAVWSGLASPSFETGRLSDLEKAIWQFNQWWTERMVLA
jgi:phenylpropionate dioxygenase-like ring-hydroxylating dioxygenase large terminal subunit